MNENDFSFDSEYLSADAEPSEEPAVQEDLPDAPQAPAAQDNPQPAAPQRTDYTRPAYGSYSYTPQQPAAYRPAPAPRPAAQPGEVYPAPTAPRSGQVNPYSAQGRYSAPSVPPRTQAPVYRSPYSVPQNGYAAPRSTYTPPVTEPSASASHSASEQPAPEKKSGGAKVAVIALCCALVGSLLGGAVVGFAMRSLYGSEPEVTPSVIVTEDIDEPEEEDPIIQPTEYDPEQSGLFTPAQIYQSNVAAIVGIANEATSYNVFGQISKTASSGTGFVISADGEILTNYHVVEGAQTLTVTMHDGASYNAVVIGYEAESDVALLKIEANDLPTVSLGDSDRLNVGDQVAAIGNPLGELTYTMTTGIVSSMDRDVNTDGTPINMMQIDAAINPGNSGGPLFDMNGNVIGITTAKYSGTLNDGATIEGIGFAIPINDVLSILDDLRENGTVPNRAYIGVTVRTVAASDAMQTPAGAQIEEVAEGSSGARAGLMAGDIITGVNGTEIKSIEDLSKALRNFRAGDSAELTVFRSGETLTLTISFDSRPTDAAVQPEETEPEETEGFNPWDFFLP
mgnify:CR=1 FL=1